MNGAKKNQKHKSLRKGDINNGAKKKSKADVSLKWDEEIASDDDDDKVPDDNAGGESEEDEETPEQARKRYELRFSCLQQFKSPSTTQFDRS